MKYCKFISQVKSSVKIVSLIALLFLLLFSISCKTKFNPSEKLSEETYSIIPEEYSGKYSNSLATYETTSSNCIISIWRNYDNKTSTFIKPIVFSHKDVDYCGRVQGPVYRDEDTSSPAYGIYYFYTNDKSQRQMTFVPVYACDYYETYIHVDDINK